MLSQPGKRLTMALERTLSGDNAQPVSDTHTRQKASLSFHPLDLPEPVYERHSLLS